jgi:hypothetical protein
LRDDEHIVILKRQSGLRGGAQQLVSHVIARLNIRQAVKADHLD